MPCCGALDLGPPEQGGRPFQCMCEWNAHVASKKKEIQVIDPIETPAETPEPETRRRGRGVIEPPKKATFEFGGVTFEFTEISKDELQGDIARISVNCTTKLRAGAWGGTVGARSQLNKGDLGTTISIRVS